MTEKNTDIVTKTDHDTTDFKSLKSLESMLSKFPLKMSLGYNCYMKLYLCKNKITQETNYFEYIGTSAWTLAELIKNDFIDHVTKKHIEYVNLLPNRTIFVNTKYYIRYVHDFKHTYKKLNDVPRIVFAEFQDKYNRRSERFLNIMKDLNKPILLLRLEEVFDADRKLFGPIADVYPSPDKGQQAVSDFEYDNFIRFLNLLKLKLNRNNYAVIYVSHVRQNQIDLNNQIIVVHYEEIIINWKESADILEKLFQENESFIVNGLSQIISHYEGK